MRLEDYNAIKEVLGELRQELREISLEIEHAYRYIREADAFILALTEDEPDDRKVFSPRKAGGANEEKIEKICREKESCEERCKALKERRDTLARRLGKLEDVLSRQAIEAPAKAEPDRTPATIVDFTRPERKAADAEPEPEEAAGAVKLNSLTEREQEILSQVAEGMLNKEIAASLNISEQTVKNHISSIFQKLEVADRTQAAVFAIKNGLGDRGNC